jgi:two-component sensor histidine kinase
MMPLGAIERIGQRNFDTDKVDQVRALHLLQVEDCVSELLDNAMSHSTEEYPEGGVKVRWAVAPDWERDAIILQVRNRCEQEPQRLHPSMNQRILESLGGEVVSEFKQDAGYPEFCTQITLPTLSDLVRLK